MESTFQIQFRRILFLLIASLLGIGCGSASEPTPISTLPQDLSVLPTVSIPNVIVKSEANLTALKVVVKLFRDNNLLADMENDTQKDVLVNDCILVEKVGRARLRFYQERLQVEVFRETEVLVREVRLESSGFTFVRLKQAFGHTRTELDEKANILVELETDLGIIRALDEKTAFLVCHAPEELTCIVALNGQIEVEALGEIVTVLGGEATYICPNQPPKPAISANLAEVRRWMDQKRGTAAIDPLGALVIGWAQVSCSDPAPLAPSDDRMVKIEAGTYTIGQSISDDYHAPLQSIELNTYWIDQYEMTNAAFKQFIDATGRSAPATWPNGVLHPSQDTHPIKNVTWEDANAYCRWANKRLPSEAEWEVAARGAGAEPRLYPWGNDPEPGFDLPRVQTYPVGSYDFNQSVFGVFDMAGNVWEWVSEPYGPVPEGQQILRGGRHGQLQNMAYRLPVEPTGTGFVSATGFRCAADHVEGE